MLVITGPLAQPRVCLIRPAERDLPGRYSARPRALDIPGPGVRGANVPCHGGAKPWEGLWGIVPTFGEYLDRRAAHVGVTVEGRALLEPTGRRGVIVPPCGDRAQRHLSHIPGIVPAG